MFVLAVTCDFKGMSNWLTRHKIATTFIAKTIISSASEEATLALLLRQSVELSAALERSSELQRPPAKGEAVLVEAHEVGPGRLQAREEQFGGERLRGLLVLAGLGQGDGDW